MFQNRVNFTHSPSPSLSRSLAPSLPSSPTHSRALPEGQHSEASLIVVFMCCVSLCPCLFHTSCHHVPSPSLSSARVSVICRRSRKTKKQTHAHTHARTKQQQNLPLSSGLCSQSSNFHIYCFFCRTVCSRRGSLFSRVAVRSIIKGWRA